MQNKLFQTKIEINGGLHDLQLRMPPARRTFGQVVSAIPRNKETLDMKLAVEISAFVEYLDGEKVFLDSALRIVKDFELFRAISEARDKMYYETFSAGRLLVHCPFCVDGQVDIDINVYIESVKDYVFACRDSNGLQKPLFLSFGFEAFQRTSGLPSASGFTVVPPSENIAISGNEGYPLGEVTLRQISKNLEKEAWLKWVCNDDENPPKGRKHWYPGHPGFTGELRLSSALLKKDKVLSPRQIDNTWLCDVLFCDAVYRLTHVIPLDVTVYCTCGGEFVPQVA